MEHLLGSYNAEESRLLDTMNKEDVDDMGLFTSMLGQIKQLLDKAEIKAVFQTSNHNEDKITVQSTWSEVRMKPGNYVATYGRHWSILRYTGRIYDCHWYIIV